MKDHDAPLATAIAGVLPSVADPFQTRNEPTLLSSATRREIDKRLRVEQELTRTAGLLFAIANETTDAVFAKDRDGKYLLFNPAASRFVGVPAEEVLGKDDTELFDAESARMVMERDRRVMESGKAETEEEELTAAGVTRIYLATKAPLHDSAGNVIGLIGISRDITERKQTEEARRQAEKRYHDIVENARAGIYQSDADGRFITVNPALARIYGYETPAELMTAFRNGAHTVYADPNTRREFVRRMSEQGFVEGFEARVARKDGSEGWTTENARAVRDANGKLLCYEGTVEDVSERKQAEVDLRRSEERYRLLFENNPLPMWVYDVETLAILAVNTAAIAHYGYSREEFLAMTITQLGRKEDVADLVGKVRGLTPTQIGRSGIRKHRRKDGSPIEVEITSHWLNFDGRAARLVLANDVTERNRAEALRERLLAILEATTDLVAISQVEGPALYINAAGRNLLSIGPEETVCLSDYRPESAKRLIMDQAIPTAIRDKIWSGETCLRSRNGDEIAVSQVLIAHRNASGEVECLSTIARDMRSQKRLEEQFRQAQKMEAVGQLAGGVAHDFNNLLTVINGFSEVLCKQFRPGDPVREFADRIHEAGERGADLTRQLLAFSRKQMLVPVVLNLNELIADVERMLARLIGEGIRLKFAPTGGLGRVKVDPGQMEQVLMNLVVNARDAMPHGGTLTIETANVEWDATDPAAQRGMPPGRYVRLAVSDTGCGMSEEIKARVFEPFFTTKGPEKGTGLGLATAYGIVKQSGGSIDVYSEPGMGTTFKIYLPRTDDEIPQRKPGSGFVPGRGTETILVVEDDENVRELTQMVLEGLGYKVLVACNGGEALLSCQQYDGDIALMVTDVVMPNMSGCQLAKHVAQFRPSMKVLFLSGYTDDAIVSHDEIDADTPFLHKPYTSAALGQKVRELLDQQPTGADWLPPRAQ